MGYIDLVLGNAAAVTLPEDPNMEGSRDITKHQCLMKLVEWKGRIPDQYYKTGSPW